MQMSYGELSSNRQPAIHEEVLHCNYNIIGKITGCIKDFYLSFQI